MRILWQKTPSVLLEVTGTEVIDCNYAFTAPRGIFGRTRSNFGQHQLTFESGVDSEADMSAMIVVFRVPKVNTTAARVDYTVKLFSNNHSGGAVRPFYSVSGAAGFVDIQSVNPTLGLTTFENADNTTFDGWLLVGWEFDGYGEGNGPSAAIIAVNDRDAVPGSITSSVVDWGFIGYLRSWHTPQFFSAQGVQLTFDDLSTSQISDGRQKYSTQGEKRRRLQFNIGPTKEEGGVIGADEAVGGLRTIADNVGTTEPLVVVPSDTRPLAPSLSMLGTLQSPISLDLVDGPYWRTPIVLEELM